MRISSRTFLHSLANSELHTRALEHGLKGIATPQSDVRTHPTCQGHPRNGSFELTTEQAWRTYIDAYPRDCAANPDVVAMNPYDVLSRVQSLRLSRGESSHVASSPAIWIHGYGIESFLPLHHHRGGQIRRDCIQSTNTSSLASGLQLWGSPRSRTRQETGSRRRNS